MASHIKGYLTAIVATAVLAVCGFCVQFIPQVVNDAMNLWWVATITIVVSLLLSGYFAGIANTTTNGFVCFLFRGIVCPIFSFLIWFYALFTDTVVSISKDFFSMSALVSGGIAIVTILFFFIVYSAIKENGSFARFVFMIAICALIYGEYALFNFLLTDAIAVPLLILPFGYMLFDFYLGSYAAFELCEDNQYTARMGKLASLASAFKKI
jgi:hypothetical protein